MQGTHGVFALRREESESNPLTNQKSIANACIVPNQLKKGGVRISDIDHATATGGEYDLFWRSDWFRYGRIIWLTQKSTAKDSAETKHPAATLCPPCSQNEYQKHARYASRP